MHPTLFGTFLEQQIVSQMLQAAVYKRLSESLTPPGPAAAIVYSPSSSVELTSSSSVPTSPPREHPCSVCGKKFRFHSNLVEHFTIHIGGKDHYFSCPLCPKQCRLKGNLKKHFTRHYDNEVDLNKAWNMLYGPSKRRRPNHMTRSCC